MKTRVLLVAAVACLAITALPVEAAVPGWPTYHLTNHRDGHNTADAPFSPDTDPVWTAALDGLAYGEPLVQGNEVFVATENDTVYSLDLHTGAVNWVQQVRTPQSSSVPLFPIDESAQGNCGNIFPLGVTSTPVLDPVTHQLFVVGAAWDGSDVNSIHHYFWALDTAAGGNPRVPGLVVDPPSNQGFTPHDQQQRSALALSGGHVYFTYGGLSGDCFTYNGWIARVDENGTGFQFRNVTVAAGIGGRGGMWSPSGPAIDDAGNLYVATGNGNQLDNAKPSDLTDSVVKLSADLTVLDHFTPTGWGDENRDDLDLSSSGPLLLAGGLVYQSGKTGGYLLNTSSLGGGNDKGGEAFFSPVCHGFGGSAYDSATDVIYAACTDGIRALQVHRAGTGSCSTTTTPCFTQLWQGPGDASAPPILAGGKVWVRGDTFGDPDPHVTSSPTNLYGLNPATGTIETLIDGVNGVAHFGTPTLAGGTLLLGSGASIIAFSRPLASNWYPLGGTIAGRTAVGANGDGRLEAFGRAADGTLHHAWQVAPGSGWTGWYPLGGDLAGDPTVATNRDGRMEAFAMGTDGRLWHAWQVAPSGGWSSWYPLGGALAGRPAVVVNGDGRLEAFARGADNALWHVWQTSPGGGWGGLYSLGGAITDDPAGGTNADGRAEAFGRAPDGTVAHTWQVAPGGGWSAWYSLGGAITGSPAVASNPDGRFEILGLGTNAANWHAWQLTPGGGWYPFTSLGGNFSVSPILTCNRDGRLEAFAVDAGGLVAHSAQLSVGGGWEPWVALNGFNAGAGPSVGANSDGRLELVVPSTDASAWHIWQRSPGHNW